MLEYWVRRFQEQTIIETQNLGCYVTFLYGFGWKNYKYFFSHIVIFRYIEYVQIKIGHYIFIVIY